MDRTERFYKIDQLLHSGTRTFAELQKALSVSRAMLKRDLEELRVEHPAAAAGVRGGGAAD